MLRSDRTPSATAERDEANFFGLEIRPVDTQRKNLWIGRLGATLLMLAAACSPAPRPAGLDAEAPEFVLAIHGGAGNIGPMPAEREAEYKASLSAALLAGHAVLQQGGSSLDAVEAAINLMEDNPLFNAGKGAVFTAAGVNEMDAAIMDGATLQAGAVAGLRHVRNPIDLARAVLQHSPHVMMIGEGAETFAREQGVVLVDSTYFYTESRWRSLERAREQERAAGSAARGGYSVPDEFKFGTVGAVALDRAGNLAAGTSTGGMTNKRWGRVGDVPIIGAGTYANNQTCAVSATGHGEFFIRNVVAHGICSLAEHTGLTLRQAADSVVMGTLVRQRGEGGVIALDRRGNIAMPFNSTGMFRGWIGPDGVPHTAIYQEP